MAAARSCSLAEVCACAAVSPRAAPPTCPVASSFARRVLAVNPSVLKVYLQAVLGVEP